MVPCRVKPEDPGASARSVALASLLDAAQALLLRSQLLALRSQVCSNRFYLSLEQPGTSTAQEPTTGTHRRQLDRRSRCALHLLERFSGHPHVPQSFEYLKFRLRHPTAMPVPPFIVLRDIELFDECRGVLDKHR